MSIPILMDFNMMTTYQVTLQPDCPIPPIANNWYKFRHEVAKEWDAPFLARIEKFKSLIGDDVATRESFSLID